MDLIKYIDSRFHGLNRSYLHAAGLSTDAKPVAGVVTGSIFDEVDTGSRYIFDEAAGQWMPWPEPGQDGGVTSLDETVLASGVFDALGIPPYLDEAALDNYSAYGLTEPGWYVFARVPAPDGEPVPAGASVTGAAGYVIGADYIDVAVRFEVAAMAVPVTIDWVSHADRLVFRATDLAAAVIDEVAPLVHGKNHYDPDACGPEDQVGYWNGTKSALTAYACTGKIPVAAGTQYIFSAGGVLVKYCEFFSGETGGTFISRVTLDNAAFTTPSGCTHVAIMLFAATHTTADYEAAIAAGQLEEGDTATPYEPYSLKRQVALESVEDGEKLLSTLAVMVTASPVNLYDKALAVNGKYLMQGSIASDAGWAYTGMIPVRANTQYNLSIDPAAPMELVTAYYEYDANGAYIGVTTGGKRYLVPIKTGASTAYVAVNFTLTGHTAQDFADTIDTMMLVYGTTRPGSYYAYAPQLMADAAKLSSAYADGYGAFGGKKWLATGTSLTWYDGKTYQAGVHAGEICQGYVGVISRRLGLIVTNEGINGSTLGNVSSDSLINRYTTLDWAGVDIATIEYGINDFGKSVPVGAASDAAGTGTFAACLKTVIEYALNQNPTLLLIICTDPDVRGANVNSNNNTLKDYADVTLEIADQYRLPVCDWFYRSGINALNKGGQTDDWMTADGTHPNDKGNARMGAMLARVMEGMV